MLVFNREKKNRIQNDNVETGYQKLKKQVKTVSSENKLLKSVRSLVLVYGPQNWKTNMDNSFEEISFKIRLC